MNALSLILKHENWPLKLSNYDRRPLSETELMTMNEFLHKRARRADWFAQAQTDLSRLLTPMTDAMHLLSVKPKYRNEFIATLFQQQIQWETVFWDWRTEQWLMTYDTVVEKRQRGVMASNISLFLKLAYLLVGFAEFDRHNLFDSLGFAKLVFDPQDFARSQQHILKTLLEAGISETWCQKWIPSALAVLSLKHYTSDLFAISRETLVATMDNTLSKHRHEAYLRFAFALEQLALLPTDPLISFVPYNAKTVTNDARSGIDTQWLTWIDRWRQVSPYSPANRKTHYRCLLLVGRWLARSHPDITSPENWTRELAVTFVAAVDRLKVGDWAHLHYKQKDGQPISAYTKERYISVVRTFFTDLQEWGWIPRHFDAGRYLVSPRTVRGLLGPQPKPIDSAIWKKLVITTLNLQPDNLRSQRYPFALVKALATMWVFSGLRPDEIRRLPVGCLRFSQDKDEQVCWLDVPANKLNPAYTKPVDSVLGQLVQEWEQLRPPSTPYTDTKSGQPVHYLFADEGKHISRHYLAQILIPFLCELAGVPESDSYGRITPNRARHTIAYQLANGRNPMPFLELQNWLGHRSPDSTLYYTTRSHLELSRAIEQYTTQNTRLATVLVDREAIASGAVQHGEPWKYYDVGHGFCTHDFFETCPHRIACARCASYVPKASSVPQLQQAHDNLLQMRAAIPLTDAMVTAIDEGVEAITNLLETLADIPTLSGETPRQLGTSDQRQLTLIAPQDIPILPATS